MTSELKENFNKYWMLCAMNCEIEKFRIKYSLSLKQRMFKNLNEKKKEGKNVYNTYVYPFIPITRNFACLSLYNCQLYCSRFVCMYVNVSSVYK